MPSRFQLDANGNPGMAIMPRVCQVVAVSGSSAQSAALDVNTTIIRLVATTNCWVALGTNPTAQQHAVTTTQPGVSLGSFYLAAGVVETWAAPSAIPAGSSWKVAVIQDTAGGYLSITEAQ